MYEHKEVDECFDWIRRAGWDCFVTLKYPREPSPRHTGTRAWTAEDAFGGWTYENFLNLGKSSFDGYVRATEHRDNGDVLFHTLLRGMSSEWFEEHSRRRWFDMSAGAAWERPFDEKIERLFKYFFYKMRCDIECYIVGDIKVYRADEYSAK
jgi:hypothetical protein